MVLHFLHRTSDGFVGYQNGSVYLLRNFR